jgi:isopentenyl-diphosphate delta-isomerase type 1
MGQNLDELFDVVDEHDVVIGQETRGRVHAQNLRHRAVHIFVFNTAGDVLLQLRSATKDKFPNCWDSSCSGHVDAGEDYDTAAWRELREELGLIEPTRLMIDWTFLGKIEARPETGQEFVKVYACRYEGPFQASPTEIQELRWFGPGALDGLMLNQRDQVADALAFLWARGWVRPRPQITD